ncbi:MAG: tetratricopeptide repeat protein, partial [Nitrospirae bacterium]
YNRLGKYREAVEAFKNCVKLMPTYAVAYNNLAYSYSRLGMLKERISALEKAVQLRPSYATAHLNLGLAYLDAGDIKKAQREYQTLSKLHQRFADELLKKIKEKGGLS